uniref:Protein kinase domain-containing protein n=1 Tax=Macrostomum lignano TaxID=282301 RepID=A0A1I8FDP2_9PLAT
MMRIEVDIFCTDAQDMFDSDATGQGATGAYQIFCAKKLAALKSRPQARRVATLDPATGNSGGGTWSVDGAPRRRQISSVRRPDAWQLLSANMEAILAKFRLSRRPSTMLARGGGGGSFVYNPRSLVLYWPLAAAAAPATPYRRPRTGRHERHRLVRTESRPDGRGGFNGSAGWTNTEAASYHGGCGAGWLSGGARRADPSTAAPDTAGAVRRRRTRRNESWRRWWLWRWRRRSEDNGASGGGGGYSGGGAGTHDKQAGGGGGSFCNATMSLSNSCSSVTGGNEAALTARHIYYLDNQRSSAAASPFAFGFLRHCSSVLAAAATLGYPARRKSRTGASLQLDLACGPCGRTARGGGGRHGVVPAPHTAERARSAAAGEASATGLNGAEPSPTRNCPGEAAPELEEMSRRPAAEAWRGRQPAFAAASRRRQPRRRGATPRRKPRPAAAVKLATLPLLARRYRRPRGRRSPPPPVSPDTARIRSSSRATRLRLTREATPVRGWLAIDGDANGEAATAQGHRSVANKEGRKRSGEDKETDEMPELRKRQVGTDSAKRRASQIRRLSRLSLSRPHPNSRHTPQVDLQDATFLPDPAADRQMQQQQQQQRRRALRCSLWHGQTEPQPARQRSVS